MKVASSAKSNFRKALQDSSISWTPSDSEVEKLIRSIRSAINSSSPTTLADEGQLLVKALSPVYLALREAEALDWMDSDQWAFLMWDIYTAAASNTQSAARCPKITDSSDGWSDMITIVIATPLPHDVITTSPFWYRRKSITAILWTCSLLLAWATSWEFPGRHKVWMCLAGGSGFVAGELWRRSGWNLFETSHELPRSPQQANDDNASVASSGSSKLRAEHEALQLKLLELERKVTQQGRPAPPAGAPPLPAPAHPPVATSSPLMESFRIMADGGADSGPFFVQPGGVPKPWVPDSGGDTGAVPPIDISDVVVLKNMVKQKELNGKRGVVVELVGNNKVNVKLADGSMVKFLHIAYVEISQVNETDIDGPQLENIVREIFCQPQVLAAEVAFADLADNYYNPAGFSEVELNKSQAKRSKTCWSFGPAGSLPFRPGRSSFGKMSMHSLLSLPWSKLLCRRRDTSAPILSPCPESKNSRRSFTLSSSPVCQHMVRQPPFWVRQTPTITTR